MAVVSFRFFEKPFDHPARLYLPDLSQVIDLEELVQTSLRLVSLDPLAGEKPEEELFLRKGHAVAVAVLLATPVPALIILYLLSLMCLFLRPAFDEYILTWIDAQEHLSVPGLHLETLRLLFHGIALLLVFEKN